jgi:hypothetical protein
MKSIILHDFEVRNALKNDAIQIRRPVKYHDVYGNTECDIERVRMTESGLELRFHTDNVALIKCPFGQPGDWRWVKETWKQYEKAVGYGEGFHIVNFLAYKADETINSVIKPCEWYDGNWRPSIHMPREASRILLEMEEIRVERVQDITEDDAKAEGFEDGCDSLGDGKFDDVLEREWTARDEFCDVWDSLYAKKGFGWDNNLPVWVGKFKVTERK